MIAIWTAAAPFLAAATARLDQAGVPYTLLPDEFDTAALRSAANAEILIVGGAPVPREMIKALDKTRLIVRGGVGVDRIDLTAAAERGIVVTNVADYATDEVADHTIMLILTVARRLTHYRVRTAQHWHYVDYPPVMRLRGSRLGIIGLGLIGRAVANRGAALGMNVTAYDPLVEEERFAESNATRIGLEALLADSDVISLHVPLTSETRHLLDTAAFATMRTKPIIVNTARGELIDTGALVRALDSGDVAGAGIDVLEDEPDVSRHSTLFDRDNVIITPHVAWYSHGSRHQLGQTAAQKALDYLQGITPDALKPSEEHTK